MRGTAPTAVASASRQLLRSFRPPAGLGVISQHQGPHHRATAVLPSQRSGHRSAPASLGWSRSTSVPSNAWNNMDTPAKRAKRRACEKEDSPMPAEGGMWMAGSGVDAPALSTVGDSAGITFCVPGLTVTDHFFEVPLDHWSTEEEGQTISVFAREISAYGKQRRAPYLLYLQGGPGFEASRPIEASGWIKAASIHFNIILLDQRGTGRSAPITVKNLKKKGTPEAQADYLSHFRANSIVADCEIIRKELVPPTNHMGKWSIIGQSFGGFCCTTYLSCAPQGLTEVLMTGGVPPLISELNGAEEAYTHLYKRVMWQNEKYYQRFPGDVPIVHSIVTHLASQPDGGALMPSGSLLTPRYFQTLGLSGLGSGGGFERLHYLLENAWDGDELSYNFLLVCDNWGAWDTNPLYCLLHESIYCNGPGPASAWAAHRVRERDFSSIFDAELAVKESRPVFFTGEQVFPWMLEDVAALRPYKETAELVAQRTTWRPLYDLKVLQQNRVPVACAVYYEDMYVDFNLCQRTLQHIRGGRQWISNEFLHSGIRDDGARIFEALINLVRGGVPLR